MRANEKLTVDEKLISTRTYLVYTGLFLVMTGLIYSYFIYTQTSFIWENDGFTQHYQLFLDYITKIRTWVSEGTVTLWDWHIGLGADVLYSYGYYVIGDPFVYLGLLFPSHLMELGYHLLILLRIWAIGISFLFFLGSQRISHHAGLAAAIAYAFTHFVIFNVTRHPFFLLPLIWYPLLCLGIERLLKNKSSGLFILAVMISALSNFYFFYKLTLLAFLYALIRFFYLNPDWKWKTLFKIFLKTTYAYIVGLLMSAVLFLPMVYGFLNSSRQAGGVAFNPYFYTVEYYISLIIHTLTPGSYFWVIGGFPILSLFGMVFIWKKRRYGYIRWMAIILLVILMIPFLGSVMNGLSGPYNRFTFVLPFIFSLALAYFIDARKDLTTVDLKRMKRLLISFTGLSFFGYFLFDEKNAFYMFFPLVIGWGLWFYFKRPLQKRLSYKKESWLVIILVMLNMTGNAVYYYSPLGMNAMSGNLDYGEAEKRYGDVLGGKEEYLQEISNEPYRVGVTSKDNHVKNQFLYLNLMGVNSYLSLTNGSVADFARAIETGGFQIIQPLRNGIDDRRIANHLLGVKSIITHADNEPYLPFGYVINQTINDDENERFILAETQDAYPFAYTIDHALSDTEFMKMNAVKREAVLSKNVVLKDAVHEELSLDKASDEPSVKELAFDIFSSEGNPVALSKDTFRVDEADQRFTLRLKNPKALYEAELYLRFSGLDYQPLSPRPFLRQSTHYRLTVDDGRKAKSIYQSDKTSFSSYFHREHMLFNMGDVSEEEPVSEIQVSVDQPGVYQLQDITIYALPVNKEVDARLAAEKRAHALDIESFADDQVEGSVTVDENEILVTSIPYSKGWTASVNGNDQDVLKVNKGFVGLTLDEGENSIRLTYDTPYLKQGMVLSLIGVALAIFLRIKPLKKHK
ncbi:YfhO family protein [Alkalibacterium kapii]|uniref:YfhO family protein n=1 Tax=Alkalibacterium kapii TaxID=426704 RepID=A0A511AT84_9LACT|nr:YfhO family protein [Alkalibacterium kapii]GEK91419.1 hypothetical protein AKA01nite_10410 [Alkalibacterium kapii]